MTNIWVETTPTFVMIVDWFIQLEDNPLLLLKEFPPDRHQIILFRNSHPSCGEINQDLDLGHADADDDDGDGNDDGGDDNDDEDGE